MLIDELLPSQAEAVVFPLVGEMTIACLAFVILKFLGEANSLLVLERWETTGGLALLLLT